eukprot:Pgem_evm1s7446
MNSAATQHGQFIFQNEQLRQSIMKWTWEPKEAIEQNKSWVFKRHRDKYLFEVVNTIKFEHSFVNYFEFENKKDWYEVNLNICAVDYAALKGSLDIIKFFDFLGVGKSDCEVTRKNDHVSEEFLQQGHNRSMAMDWGAAEGYLSVLKYFYTKQRQQNIEFKISTYAMDKAA